MSSEWAALLGSWEWAPALLAVLLLMATIYLRGWFILRRRAPQRWPASTALAFCSGLAVLYVALASPVEAFAGLFLSAHMVQHLLLMMVAPPLLWFGEPLLPLVRGLPVGIRQVWVVPWLTDPLLNRCLASLTQPMVAAALLVVTMWIWHLPGVYGWALANESAHRFQHASFFLAGMLFWYGVVRPNPSRPKYSRWWLLPALLLADVGNTALAAVLTFSERPLYAHYAEAPRIGGWSALEDQSAAGVLMWVPGSLVFLLPLAVLGTRLLGPQAKLPQASRQRLDLHPRTIPLPMYAAVNEARPGFDVLRLPLLGRFLKWRHARLCLQLPLLLLALAIVWDGLAGPQVAGMNLAGVLPWIHWRGLLILGLLAVGNVFCLSCPILLPRTLVRRWWSPVWSWPRWLRSKWLAILLLGLFLWAYEAFALWDRPAWTALLVISYFATALVVDTLFSGASFCKYLCPLGQFNFVQSTMSPLEIGVAKPEACTTCAGKECLRGGQHSSGCELNLYLPRKVGNLDCTLCLDCVHACPHDNVALRPRLPAAELWYTGSRSSLGRLSRRPDLAALMVLLVFGAFANAAGMVAPVVETQTRLAQAWNWPMLWVCTASYAVALVLVPMALLTLAAWGTKILGEERAGIVAIATRQSAALVPLGFAMWLAHYSFHFFTSWDTIIPVAQRLAQEVGMQSLGSPAWMPGCCRPTANWLLPLELLFLDVGLLVSLYSSWRLARGWRGWLPWALLHLLLFTTGVWILFQPMEMRGTVQ